MTKTTRKVRKAVIPAAGLGTRMLPATKAIPKELLAVFTKPSIQLIVEEAKDSGIEQVILVTSREKFELEDHFDSAPDLEAILAARGKTELLDEVRRVTNLVDLVAVRQHRPLGLGHAILCARHVVGDEPFAVFLPDDLIDCERPGARQLIDVYEQTGNSVLALMEVAASQTHQYGIASGSPLDVPARTIRVDRLVEKPKQDPPSNLAVVGRYVLSPDIWDALAVTQPGAGGEIQLTDAIAVLAARQEVVGHLFEGQRYDVGDLTGYLLANLNWASKDPKIWPAIRDWIRARER